MSAVDIGLAVRLCSDWRVQSEYYLARAYLAEARRAREGLRVLAYTIEPCERAARGWEGHARKVLAGVRL